MLARSWVVFTSTAVLALALAAPLLGTAPVDAAPSTGVALLALVLTVLMAVGSRYARLPARAVSVGALGSITREPEVTAGLTDPPHHPLRPRAPGLA